MGILGLGVRARLLSPPRQPQLFTALYVLFVITGIADYFSMWYSAYTAFGYNPMVLWGAIEMPVKAYIMLLDSRYWANLSLDGGNSNASVDEVQGDELTGVVAVEMARSRSSGSERVP